MSAAGGGKARGFVGGGEGGLVPIRMDSVAGLEFRECGTAGDIQHLLAHPFHLAQRVILVHELLKVHQKRHVRLRSRSASEDPIPAIRASWAGGISSTAC